MDSWKRFNELIPLEEDYCYSKLYTKEITKEDSKHVKNIRGTFKIKTLGEYHDLYVQSDTALLADVFENFRDKCIKIYKIDPAYFVSAPGLAWQACLKKTGVKLDLLTDIDMLLMFEEGIWGGMCQATYRYAKASNKYMTNYNKNKESSYLQYLDANNLYGWAMSQKLPVGDFKWVEKDNILNFMKDYDINSDKGYIFEVDIEYPKNLYKLHSDLSFLPERMKINNSKKLGCSVYNKENYVIHIRYLKQALDHGLILNTVHKVIEFRQGAWLKPYIDMNTELRKHAKNESDKEIFQLMNNSACGKTMENVRNHRDIRLVTTHKRRCILASEPNYYLTKYISNYLLIMEMKMTEVRMNKPIYLGQAILDLSKTLIYEFWYNHIKPMYRDKARLCYTDTDSFIIHIKTEDVYKDISNDID